MFETTRTNGTAIRRRIKKKIQVKSRGSRGAISSSKSLKGTQTGRDGVSRDEACMRNPNGTKNRATVKAVVYVLWVQGGPVRVGCFAFQTRRTPNVGREKKKLFFFFFPTRRDGFFRSQKIVRVPSFMYAYSFFFRNANLNAKCILPPTPYATEMIDTQN